MLLGHLRMEHDLQQQIAQFVLEVPHVAAINRIGDFVGFLNGVWRDAGEGLLHIPWATGLRIAQRGHDRQQRIDALDVGHAA